MNWQDEGFIISKKKFRENAIILEIFTSQFGKVSGIVYGGTSRKIKNYLQLINKIFIVYRSKNENRIGYFKTELIDAISPKYFNNKKKILCLNSLSSILSILLPENLSYKKVYQSLNDLLNKFDDKNWLTHYLNWELDLINNLGFGFDINPEKFPEIHSKKIHNITIDNIQYNIPAFLVLKKFNNINLEEIYHGLNFCRNLMENKFFNPNNIRFPHSRRLLENKFL
jgi:DNA repair protein RecO (recombination protein O)